MCFYHGLLHGEKNWGLTRERLHATIAHIFLGIFPWLLPLMAMHDTTDNKRGAYGKSASVTWASSKRCLHCRREGGRGIFPREPTDFFREIPCDFILGHAPDSFAARHLNSVGGVA